MNGTWRKSTFCYASECVEVQGGTHVRVRDSGLRDASPVLAFTPAAWQTFTETVARAGFEPAAYGL